MRRTDIRGGTSRKESGTRQDDQYECCNDPGTGTFFHRERPLFNRKDCIRSRTDVSEGLLADRFLNGTARIVLIY